jgi:hypothetical protein
MLRVPAPNKPYIAVNLGGIYPVVCAAEKAKYIAISGNINMSE